MAPRRHGGAARPSPPLPSRLGFLTASPRAQGRRRGASRAGVALCRSLAWLPGFNLWATLLPAPRRVQPLDRSVLAAGFGEEGGEGWRSEGEGSGRWEEGAAADLANCELPFLPKDWSRSAGERGHGGVSSATKLRASAGLGATSSLARRNPLSIGSARFFSPYLFLCSSSFF